VHRATLPQPAPHPRVGHGPARELTRTFGVGCGNVSIGEHAEPSTHTSGVYPMATFWWHLSPGTAFVVSTPLRVHKGVFF